MTLKHIILILSILLIPVAGYAAMRFIVSVVPDLSNGLYLALAGFMLVVVGLTVPYLMLKALFHSAHKRSSSEHELHLKDLPKDQDVIQGGSNKYRARVTRTNSQSRRSA